jgi:hypothetical protein
MCESSGFGEIQGCRNVHQGQLGIGQHVASRGGACQRSAAYPRLAPAPTGSRLELARDLALRLTSAGTHV